MEIVSPLQYRRNVRSCRRTGTRATRRARLLLGLAVGWSADVCGGVGCVRRIVNLIVDRGSCLRVGVDGGCLVGGRLVAPVFLAGGRERAAERAEHGERELQNRDQPGVWRPQFRTPG